jgi:transcriptional regulator with XRE-family HTH domain
MEALKEKIKKIRKEKRLSQSELAEIAGITRVSYTYFENGTTDKLSLDAAKGIAKALEVSFNELFEVDNPDLDKAKKEIERLKKMVKDLEADLDQALTDKKVFKELATMYMNRNPINPVDTE